MVASNMKVSDYPYIPKLMAKQIKAPAFLGNVSSILGYYTLEQPSKSEIKGIVVDSMESVEITSSRAPLLLQVDAPQMKSSSKNNGSTSDLISAEAGVAYLYHVCRDQKGQKEQKEGLNIEDNSENQTRDHSQANERDLLVGDRNHYTKSDGICVWATVMMIVSLLILGVYFIAQGK